MSKQLYSQRFILKIPSTKFRNNEWRVDISLQEARRDNELIQLADSQILRFIRDIKGINYTEEDINKVKLKIKKEKRKSTTDKSLERISKLYDKLDEMLFIEDYVSIVFNKKSDFDRACKKKGIFINGKKFKSILGTTGGIKKNTVNFCSEEIYEELNRRLENDRNEEIPCVPAKFEAYKALSASGSNPVTNTHRILVIKDGVTHIKDKVIKVSANEKGGFKVEKNVEYESDKEFCDGCGMIRPELSKQWAIDLGLTRKDENGDITYDYIPSGFNLRYSYLKGMVFTFDFEKFGREVMNNKYIVKDAWGKERDIREVDIIITTNMLKLWNAYDSIEDYLEKCDKNKYQLSVSKVCPKKLEEKRNLNYQYLQSYNLSDNDINELVSETVTNIKDCIGGDYIKSILYTKGENITKENILKSENDYIKALLINKNVIKDSYVKGKIYNMLEKKIRQAKIGVIKVDGNYSIVSNDLYALCQSMYGVEITGLLKKNQFYNKAWLDKGETEIIAFRSPMTSHNNIKRMPLINSDEVNEWFKYMNTVTILNAFDYTTDAMNGMDFDSDAIITTNNKIINKNTIDELPIICEQKSSVKEKVDIVMLQKSNKNGFGSEIGTITNRVTAMYDVLASLEKDSEEYNILMDRIICGQAYQQEEIDKIKGIQAKTMPKEWYNYKYNKLDIDKETGEILDNEEVVCEKERNIKLMVNKKPYFFIYNYDNLKSKYNLFLKEIENNSLIRFGKTFEELKNNCETEEEKQFIKSSKYKSPVFSNPCTMNRICWKIEDEFKDIKFKVKTDDKDFDYNIYKSKKRYNKDIYKEIELLYKKYNRDKREMIKNAKTNMDNNYESKDNYDMSNSKTTLLNNFKIEASKICSNSEELCNIVIDLCYKTKNNRQFAWDISGEQIIINLLNKNDKKFKYPVQDENGNIEWNGKRFKIIEMECEE